VIKYSKAQARRDLPTRTARDNKTRGGKTLVIAGSEGMWGAAVFSAMAAARTGAGYVYLFQTRKNFPVAKVPDLLVLKKIKASELKKFSAIAIGPGLQGDVFIRAWLKKLRSHPHVVVDASALAVFARLKNFRAPKTWVLTPHEGELAKMLGVSSQAIRAQREKYVRLAHKKFGVVVLLKGHRTLVATENKIWEIPTGNPSLAKAGTGDVLTGVITGFISQGVESPRAAALGAFTHGSLADRWIRSGNDVLSLLASDLLALLPSTLKKLRRQ